MNKAVIVRAKRSPIGRKDGALKKVNPQDLVAPLLKICSQDLENRIDDVVLGNIVGPGGNLARLATLTARLPDSIPGMTIDRQCSAGLEAIRTACYFIQGGAGQCYLAGGTESTSLSPFKERAQFSPLEMGDPDMGVAAEYVAEHYNITREAQDEYALLSYQRSQESFEQRYFDCEILKRPELLVDECFIKKRPMDRLIRRAKPVFKENGTITAANSCGINDGACVTTIMEEQMAIELGFTPVLRFVDSCVSGVHPFYPAIAPVPAIKTLLKRNDLAISDIDLFEMNEAFAVKIVACSRELEIPIEKLNIRGGALTMGHPYGASGAILVTRLFYEAQRREDLNYVVAAIGSGGGVGIAVLFEVVNENCNLLI
ncbi:acetyl-CoA C-acyltransferase [Terrilactibacillus laevilacticus]|uniref:acetyl-CoA C-acyltransferase n=1 Tax=Terrilactibacillus laevilacticus TaxID=1380157 RepID=UPI001146B276|nr:acetyl-CoA C-acyltransferase [Terrilactibacillus laevilacticus]